MRVHSQRRSQLSGHLDVPVGQGRPVRLLRVEIAHPLALGAAAGPAGGTGREVLRGLRGHLRLPAGARRPARVGPPVPRRDGGSCRRRLAGLDDDPRGTTPPARPAPIPARSTHTSPRRHLDRRPGPRRPQRCRRHRIASLPRPQPKPHLPRNPDATSWCRRGPCGKASDHRWRGALGPVVVGHPRRARSCRHRADGLGRYPPSLRDDLRVGLRWRRGGLDRRACHPSPAAPALSPTHRV